MKRERQCGQRAAPPIGPSVTSQRDDLLWGCTRNCNPGGAPALCESARHCDDLSAPRRLRGVAGRHSGGECRRPALTSGAIRPTTDATHARKARRPAFGAIRQSTSGNRGRWRARLPRVPLPPRVRFRDLHTSDALVLPGLPRRRMPSRRMSSGRVSSRRISPGARPASQTAASRRMRLERGCSCHASVYAVLMSGAD